LRLNTVGYLPRHEKRATLPAPCGEFQVVRVDDDSGGHRRPLHGTREQVLGDLAALSAQGVTEVFLDLNLSPRVSFPDVDAAAALEYAERVLDAFRPVNVSP